MAVSQSYRAFVLEQFGRVTPVTGKSMFGGVGIYAQGLFFALIAENWLYFKVVDATRSDCRRRTTLAKATALTKEVAKRIADDGAAAEFLEEQDRRIYSLRRRAAGKVKMEVDELWRKHVELPTRLKSAQVRGGILPLNQDCAGKPLAI